MAEHGRAPRGSPGWAPAVGRRIAKNAAANAALLSPITGKSAQTLLYDDTMAASTLQAAAAAAKDKTKGKRPLAACYCLLTSPRRRWTTPRRRARRMLLRVTPSTNCAWRSRTRTAMRQVSVRGKRRRGTHGGGSRRRDARRLRRSRPAKFALLHQVLEYLYVGGWAALNDDCRVLREQKISRVCSVVTADTPRTLPAFVTHHLHVVCRDDENAWRRVSANRSLL